MAFAVTTTNQAVTALKLLRENKNMFDLVISDVHMPDMDGFKLLELVGLEMDLPVISKPGTLHDLHHVDFSFLFILAFFGEALVIENKCVLVYLSKEKICVADPTKWFISIDICRLLIFSFSKSSTI